MDLQVILTQSKVVFQFLKGRKIIDLETALYYHNLDDVLITALDKLLKRNSIDTKTLKGYKIQGNAGRNSISYKIVATFVEGLKVKG